MILPVRNKEYLRHNSTERTIASGTRNEVIPACYQISWVSRKIDPRNFDVSPNRSRFWRSRWSSQHPDKRSVWASSRRRLPQLGAQTQLFIHVSFESHWYEYL